MIKKNPKISVIIPNWNGEKFLRACLQSLVNQTFLNKEIIVVDNNSGDNSVRLVETDFPGVRVIKLDKNYGFSQAVNAGIKKSVGEYIFLLNNDTELDSRCLEVLNRNLDKCSEAGFCAVKMLYFDERNIINDTGDVFSAYGLAHQRGKGEVDKGQYDKEGFVFGACAGAAVYRRKMLEDIGLMDEDFYAYLEDADLSFRAQLRGYKCLFIPEAVVYHVDGGTSKKIKNFSRYYNLRNSLFVMVKNFPAELFFYYFIFIVIGQARNFFMGLKHGCLRIIFKAYFDFFRLLPVMLKKRKAIQNKKRINGKYLRSIISKKYPFCASRSFKEFFKKDNK